MNKKIIALLVMSSLTVSNASFATEQTDEREHNEELVGLTSGIVLGAVVGGPVGAIIGAFTGALLGKSVGDDSEIDSQQAKLVEKDSQLIALNDDNQSLQVIASQYDEAQQQLAQLKLAQEQKLTELAMGLNIQFKTGSSELAPHIQRQLDDLAYAMSISPELNLDMTGYADRRGDSTYNQALSEQRVAEVKSYLVAQGVDENRLAFKAYGASAPLAKDQSFENDFFDRRVNIKLIPRESALAANQ
ncbi:membrane protein [Shewanella hanedai]|jgi:sortase system peptidoglycan-associated protein|uniref:Sortase-associated OmpA-like protein PdsO n=1 Tax=Shewanella hanedai TaxID=25 RepID=A0A553JS48_SHEHA|nr:sortase-associated OmpA-like protein PdsO [Shewanella hanedai]TRY15293.1 sortase-associated OmpA-like protein PdsO [Shewanella hanedai]GGI73135.1 membrane protein [Shewanella hanedai]